MSCAIHTFGTLIQPVRGSTSASTTHAVYEYAGDGPTPAPLNLPGERGGVYEPTAPSVPNFASASTTASANVRLRPSNDTRALAKLARSGATSSSSAAAAASMLFSFCAASIAALPAISVTRLEYEPRSTGVMPVSPVTQRTSYGSMPSTSATIAASTSSDPCPISVAPQNTVTCPLRSMRSCTPDCGILFQ